MKKLFLDDVRQPPGDDFIICRSFDEALNYVKEQGCPNFISFDHDLGWGPDGYDFAKWLIKLDDESNGKFIPKDFIFGVHSANPIGAKNIRTVLDNWLSFKKGLNS